MPPLRIHLLQHVPFEGPGSLAAWALEAGHVLSEHALFSGTPLPSLEAFDWLIVMGGPMSVSDDAGYPWLGEEKRFLLKAIESEKTVLGICLGAQLIASVLGARVYPNAQKEIGWYPVSRTAAGETDPWCASLAGNPTVFHWHGDTFDLPEGATHLAYSEACRHQAFRYGPRVLGLQFHLEMEAASLEGMLRHGAAELSPPGDHVQPADAIRRQSTCISDNRSRLFRLLDAMVQTTR